MRKRKLVVFTTTLVFGTMIGLCYIVPSFVLAVEDTERDICSNADANDDSSKECRQQQEGRLECGVYLALSTLPGTGIGMFAGRNFTAQEQMMQMGDHLIPIVDRPDQKFLWDSYTWVSQASSI